MALLNKGEYAHRDTLLGRYGRTLAGEYFLGIQSAVNPLEGYQISDEEVGATSYYGYLRKDGYWYIMKAVRTAAVVNYTYVAGSSGYNWAGRAGLSYVSFDNAF